MEKILLGAIVGIFVGALTVEILNRKKPGLTKEIEKKAKGTVDAFVSAFKDGFDVGEVDKTNDQSPA